MYLKKVVGQNHFKYNFLQIAPNRLDRYRITVSETLKNICLRFLLAKFCVLTLNLLFKKNNKINYFNDEAVETHFDRKMTIWLYLITYLVIQIWVLQKQLSARKIVIERESLKK